MRKVIVFAKKQGKGNSQILCGTFICKKKVFSVSSAASYISHVSLILTPYMLAEEMQSGGFLLRFFSPTF